jgi:hypothetical protein
MISWSLFACVWKKIIMKILTSDTDWRTTEIIVILIFFRSIFPKL